MSQKISILLATYNGEKFLGEQLESIFNQSYSNFELIIQDDASIDNTWQILKKYELKYGMKYSIVMNQNKSNIGYKANFASLLAKANGDFIAMCDQDDIWHKDKLEILVGNINEYSLIYANSALIDSNGVSLGRNLDDKLGNSFTDYDSCLNFLFDNSVSAHAMLFKKYLIDYILPLPENIFFDAWIASVASNINGVKYCDKSLVQYRQHSSNTLSKNLKNQVSVFEKINMKYNKKVSNRYHMSLRIKDFLNMKNLKQSDKEILENLLRYYEEFNFTWFNFKMFKCLYKYKHVFFKITSKNSFIRSLKESIGGKLYKMVPFI